MRYKKGLESTNDENVNIPTQLVTTEAQLMVHDKLEFKCCIRDMKKVIFTHQSDTVAVHRRSAVTVLR